ncbi:C-C motif chemokine 3-like [Stegastes partitus]|uniref:C-C motif chemokine 3-like n=1 Tax=Stegastes partitus TaxID=144197 RepID=A0A3B5AB10_9TELE|nr:PREDICTED: C-C motif chemokine 3-like [Stegastes partitus]
MMMKMKIALVACVLLASSLTFVATNSGFGPDQCCFKFLPKPVSKDRVVAIKATEKLCAMEGVLFRMKKGAVFCADPNAQWVKDIMEAKANEQASTPAPSQ